MSGTEFHQLQSLALNRPINPKTQEKQVLYEALREDPQVQATRYRMDYGGPSSNAKNRLMESRRMRKKMIKRINKFKTKKEDILDLLHSNGTFKPRKPKRADYANDEHKKFYHDVKKAQKNQPVPLSHDEKEEMNKLKEKYDKNQKSINEMRQRIAAIAGGKSNLNPTNVKHIRRNSKRRPKSANDATSYRNKKLPEIKSTTSPLNSYNNTILNPEEHEGQKEYEAQSHVGKPFEVDSKVQVYCTVGHSMGRIKKDFVNTGIILYFDNEKNKMKNDEKIFTKRLPRTFKPRYNNTYVIRYNDNAIEEGVVQSRITVIQSRAKIRFWVTSQI